MPMTPSETMLYFPLETLFKAPDVLSLDTHLGVLSYLSQEQGKPLLRHQVQFSASELTVILPILQSYPHYCPHEVIWASLNRGQVTEAIVASARQRLYEALSAGVWDSEMRPVRNVLSRARFKLKELGLGIGAIIENGYLLISLAPKPQSA